MLAKRSAPQPAESSEPSFEEKALAFAQDSWDFLFVRNQARTLIVLGVLVLGVALWGYQRFASARSESKAQEQLGRAFLALESGSADSARGILETVSAEHKGLAASKAALLLGDMMLTKGDLVGAETQFQHARDEAEGLPLLEGGALRGLAAVQIEQKKYAEAETTLKDILSRYQKANGDAKVRGTENEKHDLHPFLSQTMWQLALVQRKLGREADAVATAEKLVRLYPQSEEARNAGRLLAQLGKSADA